MTTHRIESADLLAERHKPRLLQLWNSQFVRDVALEDVFALDRYLDKLSNLSHLLLVSPGGEVDGWAFTFDRGGARWFTIVLDTAVQGKGYGRLLMEHLQQLEPELNGWVVDADTGLRTDGQAYASPIAFYRRLGFSVMDERLELEAISMVRIRWRKEP